MTVEVVVESDAELEQYGTVSIAYDTDSMLRIEWASGGIGGLSIGERPLESTLHVDFDAEQGEGPTRWRRWGDISHWRFLAAFEDRRRVGGAVVGHRTPGLYMLEGRPDLAVLWDLRVAPEHRSRGIGAQLFEAATKWAFGEGHATLKIESQNTNPRACQFYASRGCTLEGIHPIVDDPRIPGEVQMLWYLRP